MQTKTKRLTESAMLLAMAIVLEVVSKAFIPEMPFGGQVTLVSMLPVVLISYRHGVKWGLVSGFCYALIEMALGAKTVAAAFQPGFFGDGTMILNAIIMCLLDYVLAFTLLGLGGIFRSKIKNPGVSLMCGSLWAPDIFLTFSPDISCSPAGPSGSSPRTAFLPGAQVWCSLCPPPCWAGSTPSSTTGSTWYRR